MGVDSKHPMFVEHELDYDQMRHTYRGERVVKEKGVLYLPATSGMIADGMGSASAEGFQAYDAYRKRSRYPDVVREAVEALLGVMHRKPPTIELPAQMEDMMLRATIRNESLPMLLRRLNEEQLVQGRVGLIADVMDTGPRKDQPYLATYFAERLINWDEGARDDVDLQNLNLVVIDESEDERQPNFEWEKVTKYRVLVLGDPTENEPQGEGLYRVGVFREESADFDESGLITPAIQGRQLTGELPFVFINTKDITPEPDDPPLLGLSNLSLAIYRGEADYRQALFLQGQDTLVIIGGTDSEEKRRVGANATIELSQGGDAKYIGVDSQGLSEMRSSLENDYDRAGQKGGQLLDTIGSDQQSGEALRVRVAAKTATLNQIAITGAFGLETILKVVARWIGANEDEVVVTPNTDFSDEQGGGKMTIELMSAKQIGAPISLETVHERMQERGVTDKNFEDELKQIEAERDMDLSGPASSNPDGPETEDDDDDDEPGDGGENDDGPQGRQGGDE